jgi:dihydroneopterin aldolase
MNDMNNVLSSNDIERYYNYLRIYSNVEDSIKSRHIETINSAR